MASDFLAQFECLLYDMERALVQNNVVRIRELTAEQQSCLSELVNLAQADDRVKSDVRERMPQIKRQLAVNEALLRQAMAITDSIMVQLYTGGSTMTGGPYRPVHTYSA